MDIKSSPIIKRLETLSPKLDKFLFNLGSKDGEVRPNGDHFLVLIHNPNRKGPKPSFFNDIPIRYRYTTPLRSI